MTTTRLEFPVNVLRCAALALGALFVAQPVRATARATASVSVHDVYRGDMGRAAIFRVTNNSTMGETIGSILVVAPGPSWSVGACASAPQPRPRIDGRPDLERRPAHLRGDLR
jgi:hypothetical protein